MRTTIHILLIGGLLATAFGGVAAAQSASTGAISGTVLDPNGALIPGATVKAVRIQTGEDRTVQTDSAGRFHIPLLEVGAYRVQISAPGFASLERSAITVRVTETLSLTERLGLQSSQQSVTVTEESEQVQRVSSALGGVVDQTTIVALPLATRNFTQLMVLSPGVATSVPNAGAMGLNSIELSSQGAKASDNSVQINGNDGMNVFTNTMGSYVGTQGIAVPAPDSLEEFKVQTGQYNAATGRNAGANIAVITKSGTNQFHGVAYEFLRNDAVNAGDFFSNRVGLDKPVMKQNQFGGTFGGPIRKDQSFFFASYQGTRQRNGVSGENRSASFTQGLTDDRSLTGLGSAFQGQKGFSYLVPGGIGTAVSPDGSNINSVAFNLLSYKLPNGKYLIPTPQLANGLSVFSEPGQFSEDQWNANVDHKFGSSHRLSGKYFYSRQRSVLPLYQDNKPNTVPGFAGVIPGRNHNLAVTDTLLISSRIVNVARVGFGRWVGATDGEEPIKASDVGITTTGQVTTLPRITVLGGFSIGGSHNAQQGVETNLFSFADSLSLTLGRHSLQFGVEAKRHQSNGFDHLERHVDLIFTDFASFLLGQPSGQNQTPYSHVAAVAAFAGSFERDLRGTDLASFAQDDIRVARNLTINVGLRHDYFGALTDAVGRNSNFDFRAALAEPPAAGTNSGYIVGKDTPGELPIDVLRGSNNSLRDSRNLWNLQPRVGFSYQPLPRWTNLVVRGGYGIYYSRLAGIGGFQNAIGLPFATYSEQVLVQGSTATFQNPMPDLPPASAFPTFIPRTPGSGQTFTVQDPTLRDPYTQQYSLNIQYELRPGYLLETGYVGSKGTRLVGKVGVNQPLLAAATAPVHGITSNTQANRELRAPYQGLSSSVGQFTNGFDSRYNALQVSLTKRMTRGLQFMTGYTFAKNLSNLDQNTGGVYLDTGGVSGDQRNYAQARGPVGFDRKHRLVAGYVWVLPRLTTSAKPLQPIVNGWEMAGLLTLQSGLPLTITDSSAGSIYGGLTSSRAQLAPGIAHGTIVQNGSMSDRLNGFFNTSAFASAPVIGDGTGFGNSGKGIVRGPDQRNFDLVLSRRFKLSRLRESASLEFRAEAFNLTNTPSFANPATDRASTASFGVISGTSVNPRILAFALKLAY